MYLQNVDFATLTYNGYSIFIWNSIAMSKHAKVISSVQKHQNWRYTLFTGQQSVIFIAAEEGLVLVYQQQKPQGLVIILT